MKFAARARRPRDGGVLDYPARDGEQRIRVAALPFIHQNRFLDDFASPATGTRDYARRLREIQAELYRGLLDGCQPDRDVLVFAAHLYVQGAVPSRTERPVDISDTYLTEADALPPVSYAALGHIHKPQAVSRGGLTARYAGSPLQLDFGEAGEDKSVVVVDADPGRPVRVDLVPLQAGRRLADLHRHAGRTAGAGRPDRQRVRPGRDRQRRADPEPRRGSQRRRPAGHVRVRRPALRGVPGRRPGTGRHARRRAGPDRTCSASTCPAMYPPARSPATSWPPSPGCSPIPPAKCPGSSPRRPGCGLVLGHEPGRSWKQAGLLIPVQEARWTGAREAGRTQG